jgi:PAS domain S-box-containing protein
LESVVVNSSNGVLITNAALSEAGDLVIVFTNKAQEELSGYSKEEMFNRSPKMFQGKDTDPKTLLEVRKALTRQKPIEVDLVNYKKDGKSYWIHLSIVPVFNEKGTCTHFVGLSKDITEKKIAAESLKKANERYELLSKATNEAVYDWDIAKGTIIWSEAIYSVFGWNSIKSKQGRWKNRIHPIDRVRVVNSFTGAVEEHKPSHAEEYMFKCKSGEYKWVYDRAYIIYDEVTRKAIRMIGSLQDVTDLHNKELQLHEIARINSHVIRKPVAGILGLLNVLEKERINDAESAEIIDKLEIYARELDEVIQKVTERII